MKINGAVAVLGMGMVASQIGTPHLLTTYECDTDGRKCIRYTQCFYIGMQGWRKFYPGVAPAGDLPGREVLRAGLAAVHLAQGLKG